jgi:hypothetical protein
MNRIVLISLILCGMTWGQATPRKARPSPFDPQGIHPVKAAQLEPVKVPNGEPLSAPDAEFEGAAAARRFTAIPKHTPFHAMPLSGGSGGPVVHRIVRGEPGAEAAVDALPQLAAPQPALTMPAAFAVAIPVLHAPAQHIVATPALLAGIKPGTSYDSVVQTLGVPSSRLGYYEDGHMSETLQIEARGARIGTIHLIDGQVVSVEPVK